MAKSSWWLTSSYRGRKEKLPVLDMLHPLLEKRDDVLVIDPVINFLAFSTRLHHVHLTQPAHVMGDRRLTDPNNFRQRADIHFTGQERRDHPHPAGIRERAEQLRNMRREVFR